MTEIDLGSMLLGAACTIPIHVFIQTFISVIRNLKARIRELEDENQVLRDRRE